MEDVLYWVLAGAMEIKLRRMYWSYEDQAAE